MNKNVLIAFGGATLIALVVAMMMSAMLKSGRGKGEQQVVDSGVPPVQVMMAKQPFKVGEVLSAEKLEWKTWPAEMIYPGVMQREEQQKLADAAKGRVIRPIGQGEPILKSAIISDDGSFMAAMLKPGMRAVAVKVTAETMAGGFINPGDYVDVIMTYRAQIDAESPDEARRIQMQQVIERNLDRMATETILQNIRVLGIDQKAVKGEEDGAAKIAKTITLEVDDRQAEILALATEMGELSLSLRSLGDENIVDQNSRPAISDARLTRIYDEISKEMTRASGGTQGYVRVYNGGEVNSIPTR